MSNVKNPLFSEIATGMTMTTVNGTNFMIDKLIPFDKNGTLGSTMDQHFAMTWPFALRLNGHTSGMTWPFALRLNGHTSGMGHSHVLWGIAWKIKTGLCLSASKWRTRNG